MCAAYDSVSICFSKGLGAPVGSVLVGSKAFIAQAHRWRKMFGGGWRQAGLLAAAAHHALDHHVGRLAEDHARARRLAQAVDSMPGFSVDLDTVQTNMVYVSCDRPASEIAATLASHGVDVFDIAPTKIRIVVHLHITDEDVDRFLEVMRSAF